MCKITWLVSRLQDLTEYNTAQNRRVMVAGEEEPNVVSMKKRRRSSNCHVVFKEGEEVINPGEFEFKRMLNQQRVRTMAKLLETLEAKCLPIPDHTDLHCPIGSSRINVMESCEAFSEELERISFIFTRS